MPAFAPPFNPLVVRRGVTRRRLLIVGTSQDVVAAASTYSSRLWWVWALAQMGWPYELAGVIAGSGWTAANALAGFNSQIGAILADGPVDEIWDNVGQNDITSAAAAAAALLVEDQLVAAYAAIGVTRVVKTTANPRVTMTAALQQGLATWNFGLMQRGRQWASSSPSFQCVDMGAVLRDTTSATGAALSSLCYDDLHANSAGAMAEGQYFAESQAGNYAVMDDYPISNIDSRFSNANSSRLLVNPMLSGSGGTNDGGASGTLPASWNVGTGATAVTGAVAYATGLPRQRRWMDVTFGGAAGNFIIIRQFGGSIASYVTPGTTKVRARVPIRSSAVAATLTTLSVYCQCFDAGFGTTLNATVLTSAGGDVYGQFPASVTAEIPAFVIPLTTVYLQFIVETVWGGVPSGVIGVAEPLLEFF